MNGAVQILAATLLIAQQGSDARPNPGEVRLSRGLVSLIQQVQVPARQAGVIKALVLEDGTVVQEGLSVQKHQLLGMLDNEDALARQRAAVTEHKVAEAERRKADASIKAATATVQVADAEVEESKFINKRTPGAVPLTQVRRQELTVERAMSEEEVAKEELNTATLAIDAKQAQLDVADITVRHHQIQSPTDGVIVQLYRREGEWVSPGDAIMRIVYMDRVRVEGFVDANKYLPAEIVGREVEIAILLPHDRVEKFKSRISFVSPLVEASGEYRVWCDVENRRLDEHWILRPGMYAEMTIDLTSAPAKVAVK